MVPKPAVGLPASASIHLEQGSVAMVSSALLASVVADRIELACGEHLGHRIVETLLLVVAHSGHRSAVVGKHLPTDSPLLLVLVQIPIR